MESSYLEKFGIPRQPNLVNSISYIKMQAPYDDLNAFAGIEQFSHLWLLWQFHDNKRKNNANDFQPLIRPPRLGGNQKVGVFASRSMYRPAPIGLSVVQLLEVKQVNKEIRVYVKGADLLNGTPIIDIKPYLAYADSLPAANSGYAQITPQMLRVDWCESAQIQRQTLLLQQQTTEQTIQELEAVLSLDPTPAYHQDSSRVYGLSFANLNVKFKVAETLVTVVAIEFKLIEL